MALRRLAALTAVFLCLPGAAGFDLPSIFGGNKENGATDELDGDNFEKFMKEHPVTVILFYAPWCFYSKQILPEWDEAAHKLLLHDPPVRLAKIDTHKHSKIGDKYDISAYPTVKLFIDGMVFEYDTTDGRTWQSIVKWVNEHIDRDHVLKSADEVDKYLNDNDLNVVGLFPDVETHPTFLKSARHFPNVMFAEARGAAIAEEVAQHLSVHASLSCVTIKVGKSSNNNKTVDLPRENMHCSDKPRNAQRPDWTDAYHAIVSNKTLTVNRTDQNDGWLQNLDLKCCDDEKVSDKGKHKIPVPSVVMFMPHDERFAIYDGDLTDLHKLDRWIMARRRPMVVHLNVQTAPSVIEEGPENVPGLFLISMEPEEQLEALLKNASQHLRGRVFICISGRSSQLENRLVVLTGIEESDKETVLTLVNMNVVQGSQAQHNQEQSGRRMAKYRLDTHGLTEERLLQWVSDYEQGRLKPWLKSEPEPTAEDLADEVVHVVVGTTLVETISKVDKDVLVNFYAPWCGHCRKLEPLYKVLAKNLKHVKTLDIAKIDATRNDLAHMKIDGYPTLVLFPAGAMPKKEVHHHGHRTPEDLTKWLQEHVTHKFNPNPPAAAAAQDHDPVESGLLDPSEEDL